MRKTLVVLSVLVFMFIAASQAHAVVLNFNDLEIPGTSWTWLPSYSNSGFDLTSDQSYSSNFASAQQSQPSGYYYGSANLSNNFSSSWTTLSSSGALFTLYSIDLHRFGAFSRYINFYAYDSGNSQVGNNSLYLNDDNWNTLIFDSAFQNVAYVKWQQGPTTMSLMHTVDNIDLSGGSGSGVIPEPSSMLLLGMGLMGAGFFKRKKKA